MGRKMEERMNMREKIEQRKNMREEMEERNIGEKMERKKTQYKERKR